MTGPTAAAVIFITLRCEVSGGRITLFFPSISCLELRAFLAAYAQCHASVSVTALRCRQRPVASFRARRFAPLADYCLVASPYRRYRFMLEVYRDASER